MLFDVRKLVGELRKSAHGPRPRVHGNGFIQLDLRQDQRLHVWWPGRVPRQKVRTDIHDHIFTFNSRVVVGQLVNVRYALLINREGAFRVYEPEIRRGEDTVLHPSLALVDAEVVSCELKRADEGYGMAPHVFHETIVDRPTATVIHKFGQTLAENPDGPRPRVLVPRGQNPDNDFDRYGAPAAQLWAIIEEVLR